MAAPDTFEKTPRKAGRWFRAFILLALAYGITFSLFSIFNWLFFCAAVYSLFMSYFTLPVQPRIFQAGQQRERFDRGPTASEAASTSPQARGRKVVMVIGAVMFGMFMIPFTIGLIKGFSEDEPASEPEEQSSSSSESTDESAGTFLSRGNDFFNQQQYDSADKYYDLALVEDGSNMEAIYGKGIVLFQEGRVEDANAYFLRAYEGGFRFAWLSWALGDMYEKQGRKDRAVDLYKESVNLDSTYTDSYKRLADLDPDQRSKYLELAEKFAN